MARNHPITYLLISLLLVWPIKVTSFEHLSSNFKLGSLLLRPNRSNKLSTDLREQPSSSNQNLEVEPAERSVDLDAMEDDESRYSRLKKLVAKTMREQADRLSSRFLSLSPKLDSALVYPSQARQRGIQLNKILNISMASLNSSSVYAVDYPHGSAIFEPKEFDLATTSGLNLFEGLIETIN